MRKSAEQSLYIQRDVTSVASTNLLHKLQVKKYFKTCSFSDLNGVWLLGPLVGRSFLFLRSPEGPEGQNQYQTMLWAPLFFSFLRAHSSQLPLQRLGPLLFTGVPALKPTLGRENVHCPVGASRIQPSICYMAETK